MTSSVQVTILCSLTWVATTCGNEEFAQLEREVISYRQAISSADVTVRSETWRLRDGRLQRFSDQTYRMVVEGARQRTDTTQGLQTKALVSEDLRVLFHGKDGPLSLWKGSSEPIPRNLSLHLHNPRLLGLHPAPFSATSWGTYQSFLDNGKPRAGLVVVDLVEEGTRRSDGRYTSSGNEVRMQIDRDRGPSLVSAEVRNHGRHDAIACELQKFPGDLWFPKVVTYTQSVDTVIEYQNVVTVTAAQFQGKIDATAFSIEGLGIPADTAAIDYRDGEGQRSLVWNGRSLEPRKRGK